jgi:anti-sigma B factor antagonist
MNFQSDKSGDTAVFKVLAERLDSHISAAAKSELMNLNTEGIKNIIMDVSKVKYCDSSGLSSILVANRLCKNAGGRFVLTGVQDLVAKLISISQLDSILKMTDNTENAQKILQNA